MLIRDIIVWDYRKLRRLLDLDFIDNIDVMSNTRYNMKNDSTNINAAQVRLHVHCERSQKSCQLEINLQYPSSASSTYSTLETDILATLGKAAAVCEPSYTM